MTELSPDQHPITPPPELVQAFLRSNPVTPDGMTYEEFIATRFARWGADQELEACISLMLEKGWMNQSFADNLRAARRPKPPSLKQQALKILEEEPESDDMKELIVFDTAQVEIIRRALEALDD